MLRHIISFIMKIDRVYFLYVILILSTSLVTLYLSYITYLTAQLTDVQ